MIGTFRSSTNAIKRLSKRSINPSPSHVIQLALIEEQAFGGAWEDRKARATSKCVGHFALIASIIGIVLFAMDRLKREAEICISLYDFISRLGLRF